MNTNTSSLFPGGDDSRPGRARAAYAGDVATVSTLPHGWERESVDVSDQYVAEIRHAANPLLVAARALLRALADMPEELSAAQVAECKRLLVLEMRRFRLACERAQVRRDHILAAQYALCTALDEAAQKSKWGGEAWARNSLLVTFYQETYGGDKVFQLIGRLSTRPAEHIDVLELTYHLLGLGFEGRYNSQTQSVKTLDAIRQRLLKLIYEFRGTPPRTLSPNWRGVSPGYGKVRLRVPLWATFCMVAAILLLVYTAQQRTLQPVRASIEHRFADISARIPSTPEPLRLARLLKHEIARGQVSVREPVGRSIVTFHGDAMFAPAKTTVNDSMLPVLDKVAREIDRVQGEVQVIGHTDNQPIRRPDIPSNRVLSEMRASSVAERLRQRGVAPERLRVEGRGDTENLTDNSTPAARAKNRRVEIVVHSTMKPDQR